MKWFGMQSAFEHIRGPLSGTHGTLDKNPPGWCLTEHELVPGYLCKITMFERHRFAINGFFGGIGEIPTFSRFATYFGGHNGLCERWRR